MAVTHLLKIEGLDGEADVGGHSSAILCDSWTVGVSNKASSRSATGGGSAGVPGTASSAVVTMTASKASPKLMEQCGTGKHFKKATLITLKSTGSAPMDHIKVTLEDAVITDHTIGYTPPAAGASTEDAVKDIVTISYSKMTIEHKGQTKEGSAGAGTEGVIDFSKAKAGK